MKLDESKSPVTFELGPRPGLNEPPADPSPVEGICRLEGDQFTMAFVKAGGRPADFDRTDKKIVMVFHLTHATTRPTTTTAPGR